MKMTMREMAIAIVRHENARTSQGMTEAEIVRRGSALNDLYAKNPGLSRKAGLTARYEREMSR